MSPRYGQLAYTSFDAPGSAGGWQVKQTAGELTPSENQILVEGVRTVLTPVRSLPAYPTVEDCERGPRRLAYRRLADDSAGYWHTVPAGPDSTGRPGNVFAHAVLDRQPDAMVPLRPIQRWRSESWCRPYGPAAVAGAALPPEPPPVGEVVTAESVLAFAMDTTTWRLGTLFGLLDAVAAALAGGAPVVLGATSGESAAQWIGLVSFLMSPGTAARLNFSTFDRADQLGLGIRGGQHLTAVPVDDLPAVPADVVVVDETATLSMGEWGGQPHRTAGGQAIRVTPWSAMAQVTMLDPVSARLAVDDIGDYAAQTEDRGLHPAWPMAMSVLNRAEFADAREEAYVIVAGYSPPSAAPDSAIGHAVAGALAAIVGSSTADAWRAVQQTPDGAGADHADKTYLLRAIADPTWLDQLGPIPISPRSLHGRVPAELTAAIGPALAQAVAAGPERTVRLVDLLWRAGVGDERLLPALSDPQIVDAFGDPHAGPALAHHLGHRIGAEARSAVASATLQSHAQRSGGVSLVGDEVLDWFAESVTVPPPTELAAAQPWDVTWTRAAIRGACAQRLGPADAGDRFAQLWWLQRCGSPEFEGLAASRVWNPTDLLVAAGSDPLSTPAVLPTLLGVRTSDALDRLAEVVMENNPDQTAVACAAARRIDPRVWLQQGYVEEHQNDYTPLWDAAITQVGLGRISFDFGVRLLVLAIIADLYDVQHPSHSAVLAADPATTDAVIEQVLTLVEQRALTPETVLAASLVPATREDVEERQPTGVEDVVAAVAARIVASREFTEEDTETVSTELARMTGVDVVDGPMRRYRKMVHKLLTQRPEVQSSLTARIRGNR